MQHRILPPQLARPLIAGLALVAAALPLTACKPSQLGTPLPVRMGSTVTTAPAAGATDQAAALPR